MRYLSVCSGIEAATLAWSPLGWKPVAFSEVAPFPCALLAHYYPDVPNLGDLNDFRTWPADLAPDVLVGGTPCQSFSVAGLRGGLADPRGNLTLVYLALADRYRPEWLVWENVPGVLSHDGGRTFGAILGALGELGYGWAYRVLDARYFGVPQRRRRVFLVANSRAWQRAAAVLFEPESLRRDSPPGGQTRADVAGTLTRRALDGSSPCGGDRDGFYVAGPILGNGGRSGWRSGAEEAAAAHLIPDYADPVSAHEGDTYTHEGRGNFRLHNVVPDIVTDDVEDLEPEVAGTVSSKWAKGTGGPSGDECQNLIACFDETQITHRENRSTASPETAGLAATARPPAIAFRHELASRDGVARTPSADADGIVRLRDAGFALHEEMAPTVQAGQPHDVFDGIGVRRLMPLECERLQGLPDGYTGIRYGRKPAVDRRRYEAVGNSQAVTVMRWLGRRIDLVARAHE